MALARGTQALHVGLSVGEDVEGNSGNSGCG